MDFIKYRKTLKNIRILRKLSGRTYFTRWLHKISGICALLFFFSLFLFKDKPEVWFFIIYLLAGVSALAFFLETKKTTIYLLRKWWDIWPGKLAYSFVAVIVTLISTLLTKQIVHEITGVNPNYFSDYVSLLSIFITVMLILFLIQLFVAILSIIYLTKAYLIMFIDMFITPLTGHKNNIIPTCVRIITGNKEKYPRIVLGWYSASMALGSMTLLFVLSYPGQLIAQESKLVERYIIKSLVFLEYKTKSKCHGFSNKTKVAYINKSFVSVAKVDNDSNNYTFEVVECKY